MNFKLLRTHDLQPLRNIIYVNRMKPYVHRQLIPPDPKDYDDVGDASPTDVTELHPLDQEKLREQAKEDISMDSENMPIDIVNLGDGKHTETQTLNKQNTNNSISADFQQADAPVLNIKTKERKTQSTGDRKKSRCLRRSTRIRKNKADPDFLVGKDLDKHILSEEPE